jgi:hypothetical protein
MAWKMYLKGDSGLNETTKTCTLKNSSPLFLFKMLFSNVGLSLTGRGSKFWNLYGIPQKNRYKR